MSEVKYRCPICNRPYKTELGIINHMENKHPGEDAPIPMSVVSVEPEPGHMHGPLDGYEEDVRAQPLEPEPDGTEAPSTPQEASPAPDVQDPVQATMQLALQNTQLLNMLMGDKDNPGMIASIQQELRQIREKLSTTREPSDSPLAELNRPENEWLQEILKNVSKGVQTWALGADGRDEAFLRYLGEDAKKLIMENVKLEREAFRAFIDATKKGDIKYGSDEK